MIVLVEITKHIPASIFEMENKVVDIMIMAGYINSNLLD